MYSIVPRYLWQYDNWIQSPLLSDELLSKISKNQEDEFKLKNYVKLEEMQRIFASILSMEIEDNFAIEGIPLNSSQIRSSVIKECGLNIPDWETKRIIRAEAEQNAVKATLAALHYYDNPLTSDFLCEIHELLRPLHIPEQMNFMNKWGVFRNSGIGVKDGCTDRFIFEGPPPEYIVNFIKELCDWWNEEKRHLPGIIHGALMHLFFVEIHPFCDGNGRMARILAEMALVEKPEETFRLYSLSNAIYRNRLQYYRILEAVNSPAMVPLFLNFMVSMQGNAIKFSADYFRKKNVLNDFWQNHSKEEYSLLQVSIIENIALDMFDRKFDFTLIERMYPNIPDLRNEWDELVNQGIVQEGRFVADEETPSIGLTP